MSDLEDRVDRLEAIVDQQQDRIDQQRETIREQRERITRFESTGSVDTGSATVDRRDALKAGGLLALLVGGVGTVSANPQGRVGTETDPLQSLYTEAINGGITDGTELTNLLGDGLTLSNSTLTTDLQQVGSGTGVLDDVSADGIAYRSLLGTDGVSLTTGGGTISVGLADTRTETTTTFAESGVTVRKSGAVVDGGAIRLFSFAVTRPEDNATTADATVKFGIQIKPKRNLPGIRVTISKNTSGAANVSLTDSSGTPLTSEPFPGPQQEVTLTHPLSGGDTYYVLVDNEGNSYTAGSSAAVSFPYESEALDITSGVSVGDFPLVQSSAAYTISELSAINPNSGSATVEWDQPASVSRWTNAAFQADPDGETVDVYVETSSDGGATWSDWEVNPIAPGTDLSATPPEDRVRFRVELSRNDESNDPRLTQLTRQWRP